MKRLVLGALTLYRRLCSPDHSWISGFFPYGFCRFYPSCSEYVGSAIRKKGLIKGIVLGLGRLARCNPWNNGGIDHLH